MSPAEKGFLENPPRVQKLKSLAAIYAAEDARKAASNSPWKLLEETSCTVSDTEYEPLNFEDISSSFASEEDDLNTGGLGTFDVPLKDLRERCKASKKRKADLQQKEGDDLDEPLIVLKAKRSKSSYAARNKSSETEVISGDLNACSKVGLVAEDSPGIWESLSVQNDSSATSSSNDVTSFYQVSESPLEVEPIDIAPCKVDFIAKFDSCNLSSNLIWQTNEIRQSSENLMFYFNEQCAEIVDSEVGANSVGSTENPSDSEMITCAFNRACIDSQFKDDLCSLENNEESLDVDQITQVDSDINSAAITEDIQGSKGLISFCSEACPGDAKSSGDLYSTEDSQNTLHVSEVTVAQSDITPATEISPGGENITSSTKEECDDDIRNVENMCTPDNCLNILEEIENAHVEASKNPIMVTDTSTAHAVANTHIGNGSSDDYGYPGVPDLLDATNLRSSEGQLESIVYSAISTSSCFQNKQADTCTPVHRVLICPADSSETDGNYGQGAATKTNLDEVFKGSDQMEYTEETEEEISGVLQLSGSLEKQQSRIANDGAKLEEVNGDQITTRMHVPVKLMSNRTIISPTSQEKLCRAITDIDLCEGAQISKSKKSILFENCAGMKKFTITTESTEKVPQKTNDIIRKGTLKSTEAACTKDPSAKMDTEKAIEFSRRQMHDFENVTTKLLKNMRFMRSLLDESLAAQSPWLSKFSAEEMKVASENASELERTTKKWIALMSKDCNRFCKILKSSSNNSASPPPTSNNGVTNRRKIVFADEAGGVLCHIRVFSEASSSSTAESGSADQ